ncbi:MAG: type 1 glutamine amidotransferase [Methylacidiphilales bacterium]|nr:type 1 glutamine amidotransferase [Candidatus Methylacidiphilales bacterium]
MKISVLQHAAYEGPGEIAAWAALYDHPVSVHHLYRGDPLPPLDAFDLLVVMGGEMNIYQYRDWPWLKPESAFIASALARGKRAVGICLGAQFLADALGSRVFQNAEHELGWFPVDWTKEARAAFPALPAASTVLHWHGDTFGLPEGATRLAASEGCPEQGFLIPNKCLALQFHLEVDPSLVKQYVESQGVWPKGPYVQTGKTILNEADSPCETNRRLLHGLLDQFCR